MMNRDVAQLVSAPALGAGGPPFESEYPDKFGKEPERDFRFFFYSQPGPKNTKRVTSHPLILSLQKDSSSPSPDKKSMKRPHLQAKS